MADVPGVEFVGEEPEQPQPGAPSADRSPLRSPLRPLALAGAVLLLVLAGVVIGRGGGDGHEPAAAPGSTIVGRPTPSSSILSIPATITFGPQAIDVLALGDRVVALTATLVGVADRAGGAVTVRPAPLNLTGDRRLGRLFYDPDFHLLWVVSINGTSIGAYDIVHLESLGTMQAPEQINGAAVMNGQLWFTTDTGLYFVAGGGGRPERVPGPSVRLGPITADPAARRVFVADYAARATVRSWTSAGPLVSFRLGMTVESLTTTPGGLWAAGAAAGRAAVFRLEPDSLRPLGTVAVQRRLGSRGRIAAVFDRILLLRGEPLEPLYCVDSVTGAVKQTWSGPAGEATISRRGVLVTTGEGIAELGARGCLAG
jgi:hypothetical protein